MAYKLTNADGTTRGGTVWGEGVRHEATGDCTRPCTDGVIHSYESPYLAALLNPIHGKFSKPILWHFEEEGEFQTDGLKRWGKAGTTTKRARLPRFTIEQQIAFSIYCEKEVCRDKKWNRWADHWLDGSERGSAAAAVARAVEGVARGEPPRSRGCVGVGVHSTRPEACRTAAHRC